MTAPAPIPTGHPLGRAASGRQRGIRAIAACLAVVVATQSRPANAEVGGSLAIVTDERFRGESVSDGHPVATLDVTYDDVSGVYLAASGEVVLRAEGVRPLRAAANLGFIRKLRSEIAIDLGLVRSEYTGQYDHGSPAHYTEAYIGVNARSLSARLHYSPDYFRSGVSVVYAELDAGYSPAPGWLLEGHAGALVRLSTPYPFEDRATLVDWKLGITRREGPFAVKLAWCGRQPNEYGYENLDRRGDAVTFGIVYGF